MSWHFFSPFRSKDLSALDFFELRQRCMEGSEDARRELIARFEPLVWRTVIGRLSTIPREDQEEVVADTFIALLAENAALLVRYNPNLGLSPEGYIRRQAILQGTNRFRKLTTLKRSAEVPLEPDPELAGYDTHADSAPDAETQLVAEQALRKRLVSFRNGLPPALAITFELLYVREMNATDVAETLGCSMEVVYTRKKRLLSAIEAIMTAESPGATPGVGP